ncbi:MAG: OsmC family protein [Gemmatimonadales bacterium]
MTQEIKHVTLDWKKDLRFEGGEPNRPWVTIDGDNAAGPGPMLALLLAAAGCSAADVVHILNKMKIGLKEFRIEVDGTRREEEPRRYVAIHLAYHLRGDGLTEEKARRAINLSIEKYCSVIHSLAPDIAISYDVALG